MTVVLYVAMNGTNTPYQIRPTVKNQREKSLKRKINHINFVTKMRTVIHERISDFLPESEILIKIMMFFLSIICLVINLFRKKIFISMQLDFESKLFTNNSLKISSC